MTVRATPTTLPLFPNDRSAPRAPVFFPIEPTGLRKLAELMQPAIPTEVFACYWGFAVERQKIFFGRCQGRPGPWTNDAVLAEHRFTNAYRVSDRVSQYLVREVQNNRKWSAVDVFFRTILFKIFNRRSTWELLVHELGEPVVENFSAERYGRVLETAVRRGERIYSAAYIMPSGGPGTGYRRKHTMHLNLIARMLADGLPAKLARSKSMQDAFCLLLGYPTIGNFLAYQYVTDLNYTTLIDFDEMDFVQAGPGAHEGIAKCFRDFGGKEAEWIIRRTTEIQEQAFGAMNLKFPKLWDRSLQLIDCQNLYCEIAKYARVRFPEFNWKTGRSRIKQKFIASAEPVDYVAPPKWKVAPKNVARD